MILLPGPHKSDTSQTAPSRDRPVSRVCDRATETEPEIRRISGSSDPLEPKDVEASGQWGDAPPTQDILFLFLSGIFLFSSHFFVFPSLFAHNETQQQHPSSISRLGDPSLITVPVNSPSSPLLTPCFCYTHPHNPAKGQSQQTGQLGGIGN